METEKQTNYYVANQFQASVPFRHPEWQKLSCFIDVSLGQRKETLV